jgi:hypothetical protein
MRGQPNFFALYINENRGVMPPPPSLVLVPLLSVTFCNLVVYLKCQNGNNFRKLSVFSPTKILDISSQIQCHFWRIYLIEFRRYKCHTTSIFDSCIGIPTLICYWVPKQVPLFSIYINL